MKKPQRWINNENSCQNNRCNVLSDSVIHLLWAQHNHVALAFKH